MSELNIDELVKRLRWAPNSLETQAADVIDHLRQLLKAAKADVEKFKFQAKENEIKWVGAADEIIRLNRIIREAREQKPLGHVIKEAGSICEFVTTNDIPVGCHTVYAANGASNANT